MGIKETVRTSQGTSKPSHHSIELKYGAAKRTRQTEASNRPGDTEEDEVRWESLAGREWTLFEESGFGASLSTFPDAEDIRSRLMFDLYESAKLVS